MRMTWIRLQLYRRSLPIIRYMLLRDWQFNVVICRKWALVIIFRISSHLL